MKRFWLYFGTALALVMVIGLAIPERSWAAWAASAILSVAIVAAAGSRVRAAWKRESERQKEIVDRFNREYPPPERVETRNRQEGMSSKQDDRPDDDVECARRDSNP
ncbi:hypothetical protein OG976_11960 [Mycobacterium sp. NBC_00419]|uniref:hypothetical protein n=1 Tax=Mycobacterium sp. NBC_00419 TaxID=2975989 RepID=UPI002E24CA00